MGIGIKRILEKGVFWGSIATVAGLSWMAMSDNDPSAPPPRDSKQQAAPQPVAQVQIKIAPQPKFLPELKANPEPQERLNQIGSTLSAPMRGAVTASVDAALNSPLYPDTARHKPEAAPAMLAALTEEALKRNNGVKAAGQEITGATKGIFDALAASNRKQERLVDETLKAASSGEFDVNARSFEAAAFGDVNAALQSESGDRNAPAVKPSEVVIIPSAHHGQNETLMVTDKDIVNVANLCYAEAGNIKGADGKPTREGQQSCAATILNRLARGDGSNVDEIIRTGGFEALAVFGGMDKLPHAPEYVVGWVREVIEQHLTYGGVTAFQNTRIDRERGSDFGTALAWVGTAGNHASGTFHDLYRARYLQQREKYYGEYGIMRFPKNAVLFYEVPNYEVKIVSMEAHPLRPRRHAKDPNAIAALRG